ncbi:cuticle protein 21-like isoform X3 [Homarus americanus]|uniref:cuticle protein 21-like isoform X2 n=1 Tax=Homarus americanus TaxID=6706 RepID=UPI001C445E08|nr:cuticle protein 21-like isoform X2 [Homarus americanus]XP_042242121.1 cuticle protein 21-like isoform X3 [Homarus americanus]
MNTKVLIVLAMAALSAADSRETYSYAAPRDSSEESYESSEAQYNFNYAVKDDSSGNDFGHQETRDGDDTQGSYYVQLPDGRLQTVTYVVDGDSGYIADVKYDGEARYPDSYESFESFESREAPRYAPPRPRYFDSNESK